MNFKWINPSDQTPPKDRQILVFLSNNDFALADYCDDIEQFKVGGYCNCAYCGGTSTFYCEALDSSCDNWVHKPEILYWKDILLDIPVNYSLD